MDHWSVKKMTRDPGTCMGLEADKGSFFLPGSSAKRLSIWGTGSQPTAMGIQVFCIYPLPRRPPIGCPAAQLSARDLWGVRHTQIPHMNIHQRTCASQASSITRLTSQLAFSSIRRSSSKIVDKGPCRAVVECTSSMIAPVLAQNSSSPPPTAKQRSTAEGRRRCGHPRETSIDR